MKLSDQVIGIELNILEHCDSTSQKISYIQEMIHNAGDFNRRLPELMLKIVEENNSWAPFTIGFITALKIVAEQEKINQEDELERIFTLK